MYIYVQLLNHKMTILNQPDMMTYYSFTFGKDDNRIDHVSKRDVPLALSVYH